MSQPVITKMSAAEAVTTNLAAVNNAVEALRGGPGRLPHYDILTSAARKLDSSPSAVDDLYIIHSLCGRASDYGNIVPEVPPTFPDSHAFNPKMGTEWYWLGATMQAQDSKGRQGRVGFLWTLQKIRAVGTTVQEAAGWSDLESLLFASIATVTLDFEGEKKIVRRHPNKQWTLLGGQANFSGTGDAINITCGPDSLTGSIQVLPAKAVVSDGEHLQVNLTLKAQSGLSADKAFFLQGAPDLTTMKGTGLTGLPTPGIYYSWPQLDIDLESSSLTVQGESYTLLSGSAWIDHQMMMASLKNRNNAQKPIPFVDAPTPYNGWGWQYFNLVNGSAFTCALFEQGPMKESGFFPYGYYIRPNTAKDGWESHYVAGQFALADFQALDIPGIPQEPTKQFTISIPEKRSYDSAPPSLLGVSRLRNEAESWIPDGTFCNPDWSICSENPADFRLEYQLSENKTVEMVVGEGFLETVGFEPVPQFQERVLSYLQTGQYPPPLL